MPNENQPPLNYEQVHRLVENGLMTAMRDIGLNPTHIDPIDASDKPRIATEFRHLFIVVGTIGLFDSEDKGSGCQVSLEVFYEDPKGNKGVMPQLTSNLWNSLPPTEEEAIATVTREWVEGTFPPLCRLFGAEMGESPGTAKLESYTEGDEQMTLWEGFFGPIQAWGDESLPQKVSGALAYTLTNETLVNYQALKYLHWIEVQGVRHANGKTQITVEIHGQEDPQANAEANHKFDWTSFPNPCSFRQFYVIRPVGTKPLAEANEQIASAMQKHNIDTTPRAQREIVPEPVPEKNKSRLRWPFGRKSQ